MNSVKLGTILKIEKGKKPKNQSPKQQDGYLPYCDIKAFETGKIDSYTDGLKCLECNDGDILIVCDGSRSGLVGFAIHGYVGSTLAKLSIKGVDNKYLFYFLQSKYTLLNTNVKGTGTPHVNQTILKESIINVPSLEDQQRIVARIEELFSELDNAEEILKKTKAQLEVYKQAVLSEAFEKCNEKVKLSKLCKFITDGDHMPPPKAPIGIPFIMISNIKDNKIQWDNTAYVDDKYYDQLDVKRKPVKNDVLYTVTGSFGIPVLIDFDKQFCFQRHIALLRPSDELNPTFLYYSLKHPNVYLQAVKQATGTAQKTVGLGVLRNIEIPYTSNLEEQIKIAEELDLKENLYYEFDNSIIVVLQKINSLRQSILKEAFEGKLV